MVSEDEGVDGEKKNQSLPAHLLSRALSLARARSLALFQDAIGSLGALREAARRVPSARQEPDGSGDRWSVRCDGPGFKLGPFFVVVAVEPATEGDADDLEGGLALVHLLSGPPRRAVVRFFPSFFPFACIPFR